MRYPKSIRVTSRLQWALDTLDPSPGITRTATVMLMNCGALATVYHNILRALLLDPRARTAQYDWDSLARVRAGGVPP